MLPLCLLRHDLPLCRRLSYLLPHRRTFSTTTRTVLSPLHIPLSHPAYVVWSSNTALGTTLISSCLASSFLRSSPSKFFYLKPLQIGFPSNSDSRFVFTKVSSLFTRSCAEGYPMSLNASNSVLNPLCQLRNHYWGVVLNIRNVSMGYVIWNFTMRTEL